MFPTFDLSGQRITAVQTHHRMLACNEDFSSDNDCEGSCDCSGVELAKCKARQLKCKALSVEA